MTSGENARAVTSSNKIFLIVFTVMIWGTEYKTDMVINMVMYWYLETYMWDLS